MDEKQKKKLRDEIIELHSRAGITDYLKGKISGIQCALFILGMSKYFDEIKKEIDLELFEEDEQERDRGYF